jgi:hypothetical protein
VSSELGRFEKPEAEQYKGQRKLYLVPLLFGPEQPTPGFDELYERYWSGVLEHLLKLENSMGPIARVYHEAVGLPGTEGLDLAERLNAKSASVARSKVNSGAAFEAVEDQDLVVESMDWQRCLMVGLESRKVSGHVWAAYNDAIGKRSELMQKRIDETLKPEEAGLLFVSEEHRLQFSADLRVFYVSPPALDAIHRWIRDNRPRRTEQGAEPGEEG